MKKIDLRKAKKAPVQQKQENTDSGFQGKLPFTPGTILKTDLETKELKTIGVDDESQLPRNFASIFQKHRQQVIDDIQGATEKQKKSTSTLKISPPVNIEDLPQEKQREVRDAIDKARGKAVSEEMFAELQQQQQSAMAMLDPSIQRAMTSSEFIETVDTKKEPKPAESKDKPAQEEKSTQEEKPAVELPQEDVFQYVQAILGFQPFRKVYLRVAGRVRMLFRSLSTEVDEWISSQLAVDARDGKFLTPADVLHQEFLYRLVFGLETLTINGQTQNIAEQIDGVVAEYQEAGKDIPLPAMLQELRKLDGLSNEICWRMVVGAWREFSKLTSDLGEKIEDPNFSKSIEL